MSEEQPPEDKPPEGKSPEDAGETDPRAASPESDKWDGSAAGVPPPDGEAGSGDAERPRVTDAKEESLDYDDRTSRRLRLDVSRVENIRDIAEHINYHYYDLGQEKQARGRISVPDLARAARVHVTTSSDAQLRQSALEHQVVFACGRTGTGRRASATVVLDRLTGMCRTTSKVTVLDAASGLADLPDRLEPGCGHLLDISGETWVDTITDAQIAGAREALGPSGYLIILLEADGERSLPGTVVDHEIPDLAQVVVFQLAARLAPDGAIDTAGARALIAAACRADDATKKWHEEITSAATTGPVEAALLAEAIWSWHERLAADSSAKPRVSDFRNRRRYQQVADLLRRGDGTDSPIRQSYAIAAAVLDGLAVSEVIEGASKLSALLAEVEHPGAPGQREVFAQPLARWLRHVELVALPAEQGNRDGTVIKMPSRELSRIVIEVAWRNYDAARTPMLTWLKSLCQEHPNDRVRIRGVQALAVIAQHDYTLIKERVLEVWSASDRRIEHQAAAWLLEALVLEGAAAGKVMELLWRWSRSGDPGKRAVAVRACGTAVASYKRSEAERSEAERFDPIMGVRFSAADPWLAALPELALYEMYALGLTKEVTKELPLWMRGFPVMRVRAARVLVRISQLRQTAEGELPGSYDLLWRLAFTPDDVGVGLPEVAALWHVACRHESSRGAAWQMLGRWARSCREHPELRRAFTQLADEFEKAADTDEFRARLGVYRRRWTAYLDEEDQK
jgi:hypothetical protein